MHIRTVTYILIYTLIHVCSVRARWRCSTIFSGNSWQRNGCTDPWVAHLTCTLVKLHSNKVYVLAIVPWLPPRGDYLWGCAPSIWKHMHACMYVSMYTCTCLAAISTYAMHRSMPMHACTHTYLHTYLHTYIYIYIHIDIHAHTHHTPIRTQCNAQVTCRKLYLHGIDVPLDSETRSRLSSGAKSVMDVVVESERLDILTEGQVRHAWVLVGSAYLMCMSVWMIPAHIWTCAEDDVCLCHRPGGMEGSVFVYTFTCHVWYDRSAKNWFVKNAFSYASCACWYACTAVAYVCMFLLSTFDVPCGGFAPMCARPMYTRTASLLHIYSSHANSRLETWKTNACKERWVSFLAAWDAVCLLIKQAGVISFISNVTIVMMIIVLHFKTKCAVPDDI